MRKTKSLTSHQLVETISQIEHQIFDENFYAKYGYFFDSLINRNISPEMEYPEEFIRTVNGISFLWDNSENYTHCMNPLLVISFIPFMSGQKSLRSMLIP